MVQDGESTYENKMANQQWTITYENEKGTTYELYRDKERQRMRTKRNYY